ncbi:MAG: hypothetical protein RLZ05_1539, partial [Bacteroidota bacterium]
KGMMPLRKCQTLLVSPVSMRQRIEQLIEFEIKTAKNGKKASIVIKLNSLSDTKLIKLLYRAVAAGVEVKLIIRGIYCAHFPVSKKGLTPKAISIVDEYLEHARVLIFHHQGKEKIYISSADWMVRNLDYRVEAAVEVQHPALRKELKDILEIQLADTVKARILDAELKNEYVTHSKKNPVRSQLKIYQYLSRKKTY